MSHFHCVKSVHIWSYSGSYFPHSDCSVLVSPRSNHAKFGFYQVYSFQSKCRKIRTRKTPNTDKFHAVFVPGYPSSSLERTFENTLKEHLKIDVSLRDFSPFNFLGNLFHQCPFALIIATFVTNVKSFEDRKSVSRFMFGYNKYHQKIVLQPNYSISVTLRI